MSKNFVISHVEDEKVDADLLGRVLRKIEYQGKYTHYSDAERFFEALVENPIECRPDLILLDIGLPAINGKEALRRIRENHKLATIPVLMLSGSNSERDLNECIKSGCNGYIIKTANWTVFEEQCGNALTTWIMLKSQKFI